MISPALVNSLKPSASVDRNWAEYVDRNLFPHQPAKLLSRAEADDVWDTAPDNPVKMTAEALRQREQGVVLAPNVLEPQGEQNFQEMVAALASDREASREALLPYRSRDLSGLVLPHPVYGERHIYDVIEYSGIHDYLHHEQMTRVTQQPGYPQA